MRTVRAVCLSAAVALPVLAQQPQGTATAQNPPPRVEEPAITFSFAGGTLAQFLEQLRQGTLGLNIVAPELAKDIELPKIEFQRAPLLDALQSVAQVAPAGYQVEAFRSSSPGGSPVYTIRVRMISVPVNQGPPREEVQVFAIRGLTTGVGSLKAETVLSAIEAGGRVQGKPPEVSFHEPSGLVFVRGTNEQIGLVSTILHTLAIDRQEVTAREVTVRVGTGGEDKKDAAKKEADRKDSK